VYIVTGDSGAGITHGTIAGILLRDLIVGRDNPWVTLYDPARKMLLAANTFARENPKIADEYAHWLTPGEVSSIFWPSRAASAGRFCAFSAVSCA
jgi:glycine/D-amino acid oxidase-like deaminating enzyme